MRLRSCADQGDGDAMAEAAIGDADGGETWPCGPRCGVASRLACPDTAVRGAPTRLRAGVWAGIEGAQTVHSRSADAVEVAVPGNQTRMPELVPVLSWGNHRSPRQGA